MSPAVALRGDSPPLSANEVIAALEAATSRQDALLRAAVPHADAIAPRVIELVDAAANGAYLMPGEGNLLFWGIHILAAAKCTALYRPFVRLVSQQREDQLDLLLASAMTETLPRILLSVFDGDPGPLLDLCAHQGTEGFVRWGAFEALGRLTFDGAIPRHVTVDLLTRFERENLAEPLDAAWQGWQDTIAMLGVTELYETVRSTWHDDRSPLGPGDRKISRRGLLKRGRSRRVIQPCSRSTDENLSTIQRKRWLGSARTSHQVRAVTACGAMR